MSEFAQIVVSGVGPALPGVAGAGDLVTGPAPSAEPVDPAVLLGKKGLKYKDRATRLGLSAALAGLRDAGLRDEDGPPAVGDRIGVVVACNYGNVETICRVVTTIAAETTRGTSPMDSPNASSNIIASEIAIRFGLRGPNLTVCNGDASGLDALHWAASMLRAGRAEQILVVGVEPDHETVRKLVGADRIVDGAVAVVLERAETARTRGARAGARLGGYARADGVEECARRLGCLSPDTPGGWYVPEIVGDTELPAGLLAGVPRHAMPDDWGSLSGALGVVQCAAAVARFDAGEAGPFYALAGREDDGVAGLLLLAPGDPR
ncbi:3-oxoacyl-ACP synthase [Streptomyces scopuliridis]|uniref:3-oxoacyl-ACP synthase n=1 Tax=Streptomyces scopuliridis TaxID=452529 RepID=A0ACD4ZDV4_9ACTN|nr:beta-ketoacyl synthase N-terminal-like domain-containing protein [Streptomyces scopuliridis]WSB95962.1 3-oxoacyl-ACP synthase [Streptomyces scopuliridis]WSC10331.1 3-oxoacyl-ACP synthase [Streptomyces scopuliridis]